MKFLRKEPFGQAGNEHDAESSTADLLRAANEHPAISVRRRLHFKRAEPIGKHVSDFNQCDRCHGSHRPEVGKDPKNELRAPEHARRDADPLS